MRIPSSVSTGSSSPTAPIPRSASSGPRFAAVLDEGQAVGKPAASPVAAKPLAGGPAPPTAASPAPPGPVRAILARAMGTERQVDALLDAAARGKTFTPAQLLALQATVARYSQTVEVVSRVADRLVGAVKQTMGTQV